MAAADRNRAYLERAHAPADDVFAGILEQGRAEQIPIVDPLSGRLLHVLVEAIRPTRVVEIGTAIGYSTLWIATALPEGGRITTIDPDRARTDRARAFWRQAGVDDRIEVINAPALEALPRLAPGVDMAFIDAVKPEYIAYLDALLSLMRPGGVITADNLLWSGRVAAGDNDESTRALRAFNERLLRDPRLDATIVPVGDGIGIAVVRP